MQHSLNTISGKKKMFKPDTQIKELPKCAMSFCENKAWILIAGKFICADCVMKYENRKNAMIFETIR